MTNLFEDILSYLDDETERQALRNIGNKYKDKPELKEHYEGRLRQQDYSKNMNALKADRDKFEAEKGRIDNELAALNTWRSWRKDNWDDDLDMTKAEAEKAKQIKELTSELQVLKAAQEAGMTFEEISQYIDKELGKRPLVTKEFIDKELLPSVVDQGFYKKDADERMGRLANGMEYLYNETLPLVFQHKDEFGEILKPQELIKFANEKGVRNLAEAYSAMVAEKRAGIADKKHKEELAAAEKRGEEKARKEQTMGPNGQLPTGTGSPVMGHVQTRLQASKEKQESAIPEDVQLGSGTAARLVAEQYRKDLAEGKVLGAA